MFDVSRELLSCKKLQYSGSGSCVVWNSSRAFPDYVWYIAGDLRFPANLKRIFPFSRPFSRRTRMLMLKSNANPHTHRH